MKKSKGPCWSGYEMIGMKDKGGKKEQKNHEP